MFLKIAPELFPILIPLLVIFIPVVVLGIIVIVKKITKYAKKNQTIRQNANLDYESWFGGKSNILALEVKMSRVNVTVEDLAKVDFEQIKQLNMGVLVVENVIKCASAEFVQMIENQEK